MLIVKEDQNFKQDDLIKICKEAMIIKKQAKGGGYALKRMSKKYNFDEADISNKLQTSNILTEDEKWSHYINKKNSIKVLKSNDDFIILNWEDESFDNKNKTSIPEKKVELENKEIYRDLDKEIIIIFDHFKIKFPKHIRKLLNEQRREKIKEALLEYPLDYVKKSIDSFYLYTLIEKSKDENKTIHDDINSILGWRITEKNYELYEERKNIVNGLLTKNPVFSSEGFTQIHQAIREFCNRSETGAFELCCPTGTGKTYSAIEFMVDFIRNDKTNKVVVYLAKQKTNLEEPIKDLNNKLSEKEKKDNSIFQIRSNNDLIDYIGNNKSNFSNLFDESLKKNYDLKDKAIKALEEIVTTVQGKDLSLKQKEKLCSDKIDVLRKSIAKGFNETIYNSLNKQQRESLYALFPLNKIEDGGCKVIATTINKAIANTHKLYLKKNKAEIKSEQIINLKQKNKQPRKNDIFIIDESQNFVPAVNENNVDNTVTFPLLELIKSIYDRFNNSRYEDHENDLKFQMHIVTDALKTVFSKYKLNNRVKIRNPEDNEDVYTFLLDYQIKTLSIEKSRHLYFNIDETYNEIIFDQDLDAKDKYSYSMESVIHDLKNIIFKFHAIISTSYRKYLDNTFSDKDSVHISDPINKFVIEKQLDHNKTIGGYVKKILGMVTPNKKDNATEICDIYKILKEEIQLVNVKTREGEYASLDLAFSEGDGNKTLLEMARKNKVILLSGTADAKTVIDNCHIEFLKHNLNKDDNTVYVELSKERESAIMEEYYARFPKLTNINRKVIPIKIEDNKNWESKIERSLKGFGLDLFDINHVLRQLNSLKSSYLANRICGFINSIINFVNDSSRQIMLSCHQKFNYFNFFSEQIKEFDIDRSNYNLEACVKFIISRSKYGKDFLDEKIIIKSFDAEGYRNNIAKEQINEIAEGQKYILMGTIKAIGQGANIIFNIENRKLAEKMGYILIDENNSKDVKACIDTLYVEKPSFVLGLPMIKDVGYEKYCVDYNMRVNLLYSSNKDTTHETRIDALKKINENKGSSGNYLERHYRKTIDFDNNVNATFKQILGRIPRGNAYKSDINIIFDSNILESVSKAEQGNINYNTYEFKEVYNYSKDNFDLSQAEKMKVKFKYIKFINANSHFEIEQRIWNNKVVDAKRKYKENPKEENYEHLLKCIDNKKIFNNKVLGSIHNRNDIDVKNVYHKFESDKYYYSDEYGKIEILENKTSGYSFSYDDLNAELFCKLVNSDRNNYLELSESFDKTILPVPSMTHYLKGFRAEEYGELILQEKLNAKILKIDPLVYEDFDVLVEIAGKKLAIDFKYTEMDEYNASENKVERVKNIYPDAKYVVVNVFGKSISKNYHNNISRFCCLIDTEKEKLNTFEFLEFVKGL